ncbi:TPM domain-containing protein [Lacinutrix chionoecetis]
MNHLKLICFLFFICFQTANTQNTYPELNKIVTDKAELFSKSENLELTTKLTAYETRTTHQIVVLTINYLGNDTVENYAYQTFNLEGNKLGQKGVDNGILILVAKNDRKVRIEVGDGLTPIITDLLSKRIINHIITPAFKEGDYFKGIDKATSAIIKIIDDPIYAEEFANTEEIEEPVSLITKFISSIFLTVFFFVIGVLGYNYIILKKKLKKLSIKQLFLNNKTKFITIWLLAICFVTYFNAFFWYAFIAVFVTGFLSVFVGIGFFMLLKSVFKRAVSLFTALFTGKLGVFIFPFYLPITLMLLFAGLVFVFLPLAMGGMFLIDIVFEKSMNDIMSGVTIYHVLSVIISVIILFFITTGIVACRDIKNSLKESFGFSFFKIDKTFLRNFTGGGFSRGYSSSGSSSYSSSRSSSSSSSFSGGGGRSSGGGASGSW